MKPEEINAGMLQKRLDAKEKEKEEDLARQMRAQRAEGQTNEESKVNPIYQNWVYPAIFIGALAVLGASFCVWHARKSDKMHADSLPEDPQVVAEAAHEQALDTLPTPNHSYNRTAFYDQYVLFNSNGWARPLEKELKPGQGLLHIADPELYKHGIDRVISAILTLNPELDSPNNVQPGTYNGLKAMEKAPSRAELEARVE